MNLSIRWLGNSGVAIQRDGRVLWIDPFWADAADSERDLRDRPPDDVLFTHGHAGHFGFAASVLSHSGARLVAAEPLIEHVREAFPLQVMSERVEPGREIALNSWRLHSFEVPHPRVKEGLNVGAAPGEPNLGYVLDAGAVRLLHIGDFALTPEFENLLAGLDAPSLAMLPFWGPRVAWTVEEGTHAILRAAELTRSAALLPCYHFTGDLGPVTKLAEAASRKLPACTVLTPRPSDAFTVTTNGIQPTVEG